MFEWIAVILLVLILVYLFWKYSELKGEVENRSRELFEEWRLTDLEKQANEKAEMKAVEKANMLFQEWRSKELNLQANEKAKLLFQEWLQKEESNIREDAIKKSQAVIIGKVTEHLIPFFPDFKYNPKDVRFLGTPIDLVVFDGLNEGDVMRKVVFLEIKSGKNANLSNRERQVKKCIDNKNVAYEIIHLKGEESVKTIAGSLTMEEKISSDKSKAYSVDDIRKIHPRAYEPCTKKDDEKLISEYKSGKTMDDLVELLRRQRCGIESRLVELGLIHQ